MTMQTFRNDPYRLYRNASFLTGFFGSALPLWSLINGHWYGGMDIALFVLVVAAIPLAMYAYYLPNSFNLMAVR